MDELRKNVDALLIVNNERLCDVYADSELSVKEAFQRADNILMDAVKGISELITLPSDGGIKSDFRDVETTMKNGGGAIMAMGRASGEHRVERAILDALDSPLLYGNDIGKAKRILFNIYASDEHPIFVRELQEIDDFFDQLDPNIDVIWGTATDDSLGEDAKVTILATGLEDDLRSEVQQDIHHDEDGFYEDLIKLLYKPAQKKRVIEVLSPELPFAVAMAIHIHPQRGRAHFVQRMGKGRQMRFLHVPRKSVNDDHQRAFFRSRPGHFQLRVQPDSIINNKHALFRLSGIVFFIRCLLYRFLRKKQAGSYFKMVSVQSIDV